MHLTIGNLIQFQDSTINLNPALRDKTEENKNNSRPLQELEQTQNKKKKQKTIAEKKK